MCSVGRMYVGHVLGYQGTHTAHSKLVKPVHGTCSQCALDAEHAPGTLLKIPGTARDVPGLCHVEICCMTHQLCLLQRMLHLLF